MQSENIYQKAILGDLGDIIKLYEQFEPAHVKAENNPTQDIIKIEGKHPIHLINYTEAEIDFSESGINKLLETNQRPRAIVITDYRDNGVNRQTGTIHQLATLYIRWKKEVSILKMNVEKNESGKILFTELSMIERSLPLSQPRNRISIPADKIESLEVFSYIGYTDRQEYYCIYKDQDCIYYSIYTHGYIPNGWLPWMVVDRNLAEGDVGDGSAVPHIPLYLAELQTGSRIPITLNCFYKYETHSWKWLKTLSEDKAKLSEKKEAELTRTEAILKQRLPKLIENPSHYFLNSIGIDIAPLPSTSVRLSSTPNQIIEVYKTRRSILCDFRFYLIIKSDKRLKRKISSQVYLKKEKEEWRKVKVLGRLSHQTMGEYVLDDGSPLFRKVLKRFRGMHLEKVPQEEWLDLGIELKS